jgi:hypothetical protein
MWVVSAEGWSSTIWSLTLPSRSDSSQSYRLFPIRGVSLASPLLIPKGRFERVLIGIFLRWDLSAQPKRLDQRRWLSGCCVRP